MNTSRFVVLTVVAVIAISASAAIGAPCESVESAAASTAYQKVDALLTEQIVASHLQAVGLTSQQAHARLSQLSEQQLGQLAAQAADDRAGGTIQGGDANPLGPLGCMWHQTCVFFTNVYRLIFCWGPLK